eukprot:TRINITY_DN1712_c0_g2_i1.p1 TRINITY_DN1712_c0_g2~~TRINITY_DN1712_c0_g2_i1.p1  ORF type:complete len:489 (+),score=104.22 TRINITY_DN1712_c0_g2_i1:42-1508(+)
MSFKICYQQLFYQKTNCLSRFKKTPKHFCPGVKVVCGTDITLSKQQNKKPDYEIFDEVEIFVKSGAGGNGEIVHPGAGKYVKNFKYQPGGRQPKKLFLAAGEPADGEDGADVIIMADGNCSDLLHLHERTKYTGRNGSNGNPADGSCGARSRKKVRKKASALKISVPPGTVVKRKRGSHLIAELTQVRQSVIVAQGGRGGPGFKVPSHEQSEKLKRKKDVEVFEVVSNEDWSEVVAGQQGEELKIKLILRIVADVGIVGLPNAGKSSLLAVMTGATPEIAPYPFTTLMPNLGVMAPKAQPHKNVQDQFGQFENEFGDDKTKFSKVCADLPGLIEGAHMGRGLGRMFLRHLSRTRVLLQVVDASGEDPATDYFTVREELRMYNPEYCKRPFVVALNKMDLPDAFELREEIQNEINLMSLKLCNDNPEASSMPKAVVFTSAVNSQGVDMLCEELDSSIAEVVEHIKDRKKMEVFDWDTSLPDSDARFSGS